MTWITIIGTNPSDKAVGPRRVRKVKLIDDIITRYCIFADQLSSDIGGVDPSADVLNCDCLRKNQIGLTYFGNWLKE